MAELPRQGATKLKVGDRVQVRPLSRRALGHLDGKWGTVEKVLNEGAMAGSAHVRMDCCGELIGFGEAAITKVVRDA